MRRGARALLVAVAAFCLATPVEAPPPPGPGEAGQARMFAAEVPLNPQAPAERVFGPLRYLGGWELSSDDRRFGAISALVADGDRLVALSDQGIIFRFAPPPGSEVEIVPLAEGPGERGSKTDRDSESMLLTGGALWIGYENSNQVWRYDAATLAASAHAAPPQMERWGQNHGAEAMAQLPGGRFLVIQEDVDDEGVSEAIIFLGDPASPGTRALRLHIDPPEKERITDAAMLPDGRLLMISRGFSSWGGWTGHLLLAELPEGTGELIRVQPLGTFEAPLTRDNFEALAVVWEGGRTIVWLASDDNLFSLQRTLLLKFEWIG